jgi:uncharacterized repeat protein (TIGR03943 family)
MSRETENVLLLLVGFTIALISIAGSYTRYVKPSLLPWLVVAAAVLIGLALTCIVRDVRAGGPQHDHADDAQGHRHHSGVAWLLVAPIAVLGFVVPPALNARAAAPSVVAVSTDVLRHPFPPLPAEPAPAVRLPEVLQRIATDSAGTLKGRTITIRGFTMKDGNQTDLARVVIICCAADAQLARIHLEGPAALSATGFAENTWIEVQGQVVPGPPASTGRAIPSLAVSNVQRIDPPANTYDY